MSSHSSRSKTRSKEFSSQDLLYEGEGNKSTRDGRSLRQRLTKSVGANRKAKGKSPQADAVKTTDDIDAMSKTGASGKRARNLDTGSRSRISPPEKLPCQDVTDRNRNPSGNSASSFHNVSGSMQPEYVTATSHRDPRRTLQESRPRETNDFTGKPGRTRTQQLYKPQVTRSKTTPVASGRNQIPAGSAQRTEAWQSSESDHSRREQYPTTTNEYLGSRAQAESNSQQWLPISSAGSPHDDGLQRSSSGEHPTSNCCVPLGSKSGHRQRKKEDHSKSSTSASRQHQAREASYCQRRGHTDSVSAPGEPMVSPTRSSSGNVAQQPLAYQQHWELEGNRTFRNQPGNDRSSVSPASSSSSVSTSSHDRSGRGQKSTKSRKHVSSNADINKQKSMTRDQTRPNSRPPQRCLAEGSDTRDQSSSHLSKSRSAKQLDDPVPRNQERLLNENASLRQPTQWPRHQPMLGPNSQDHEAKSTHRGQAAATERTRRGTSQRGGSKQQGHHRTGDQMWTNDHDSNIRNSQLVQVQPCHEYQEPDRAQDSHLVRKSGSSRGGLSKPSGIGESMQRSVGKTDGDQSLSPVSVQSARSTARATGDQDRRAVLEDDADVDYNLRHAKPRHAETEYQPSQSIDGQEDYNLRSYQMTASKSSLPFPGEAARRDVDVQKPAAVGDEQMSDVDDNFNLQYGAAKTSDEPEYQEEQWAAEGSREEGKRSRSGESHLHSRHDAEGTYDDVRHFDKDPRTKEKWEREALARIKDKLRKAEMDANLVGENNIRERPATSGYHHSGNPSASATDEEASATLAVLLKECLSEGALHPGISGSKLRGLLNYQLKHYLARGRGELPAKVHRRELKAAQERLEFYTDHDLEQLADGIMSDENISMITYKMMKQMIAED